MKVKKLYIPILLLLLANNAIGQNEIVGGKADIDFNLQNGTGETNGYHLVWQDLFDQNELDSEAWNVEVRNDGGGNNELQYYIKDNVTLETDKDGNGCLVLTAKRQRYENKDFTSGRLTTQNKVYFCHGKIEASIKIPKTANGLWPAFWLLGNDIEYNNWPYCGEIDILEMGNSDCFENGTQDRYFNGACHWGPFINNGHPNYSKSNTWSYSLQDDKFHLYTLYWDDKRIAMYVDQDIDPNTMPYYEMDISDKSQDNSPGIYFHHEFFILFNLAVGGDFSHIYSADGVTALRNGEAKMYVNYVKIYQKGDEGESYNGPIQNFVDTEEIMFADSSYDIFASIYSINGTYLGSYTSINFDALPPGMYVLRTDNGIFKKVAKK